MGSKQWPESRETFLAFSDLNTNIFQTNTFATSYGKLTLKNNYDVIGIELIMLKKL